MSKDLALPNPSIATSHPLHILKHYLASLEPIDKITDKSVRGKLQRNRQDEILRVADFLFGSSALNGAVEVLDCGSISQVVSIPSQRSLYFVKGSTRGKSSSSNYLCLLPTHGLAYCSCRSFLEGGCRSSSSGIFICKHLLALLLMPALQLKCSVTETISDFEFGRMVLNRMEFD